MTSVIRLCDGGESSNCNTKGMRLTNAFILIALFISPDKRDKYDSSINLSLLIIKSVNNELESIFDLNPLIKSCVIVLQLIDIVKA